MRSAIATAAPTGTLSFAPGSGHVWAVWAVVLGGCALAPPAAVAPAPAVPAGWTAQAAAAAPDTLARWWLRFGDPTLSALVERALDAATDVQAAQARLRQARAARDAAGAALVPNLSANASVQFGDSEARPPTRQYRVGFDAGWEIDLWGGARAAQAAADADAQSSEAALGQTRVALAAEVAATLIELRSAQARRVATAAALASQEHTLRITEWRQQAGLTTQLDVLQQRSAVAQTRAQLPALQVAIEQSMNALAVLTAQAPGALHPTLAAPAALPAAPPDLALEIPAAVLSQRADVQAAEARVRAAAARLAQARAARLPSLQLSGSIGLNALALGGLSSGAGVASLLAGLSLPLFDGGRLAAQARGQQAALDAARIEHHAALLGALREVEDTLVALRGAREQLASQQEAAQSARHAARLAEQRYASGLVDFQSVLATQRTLLGADDAATGTAAALATQHVRLYKALGGGWTATPADGGGGESP